MIRIATIKGTGSQASHVRNSLALAAKNLCWKRMKELGSTTLTSTSINKNEEFLESKKCMSENKDNSGAGIKLNFFLGIKGSEPEVTGSTPSPTPTK